MTEDIIRKNMKEIIKRSWKDEKFKEALIKDPKGTLKSEYGIVIPEGIQLDVVEDTREKTTLILPAPMELSDEDMEAVVGGVSIGPCGYDCGWCFLRAICSSNTFHG
jgi:hypothetical protein